MVRSFATSEIVELGVQIEINGKEFYEMLAKGIKDKNVKEVFAYLAGEETKHIEKFREILGSIQDYKPKNAYPPDYFAYMNSLASEHVFTKKNKGKEIARKIKNSREAIDFGIKFEKESVLFYEGMKKSVPESDSGKIDILIGEEKDHTRKLLDLRRAL